MELKSQQAMMDQIESNKHDNINENSQYAHVIIIFSLASGYLAK